MPKAGKIFPSASGNKRPPAAISVGQAREGEESMWGDRGRRKEFERLMLPSMPAAYRLAWAIVRNSDDAADAVQDAYLRAYAAFGGYRGDSARAWLLAIVRNAALGILRTRSRHANVISFEAASHGAYAISADPSPECLASQRGEMHRLQGALGDLPIAWREAILLREIEGLSYREIAQVLQVPQGTVMSRLSRAREQLRASLADGEPCERRE